jgi:hypothetical protein
VGGGGVGDGDNGGGLHDTKIKKKDEHVFLKANKLMEKTCHGSLNQTNNQTNNNRTDT